MQRRLDQLLTRDTAVRDNQAMGAPSDIAEAARLAGYVITGRPIRGGMSTVYPARRLGEGPPDTALKVLHDTENEPGRDAAERLAREAELLRSIDHAAIASFVEAGELTTGAAFLASAWIPGPTLHASLVEAGAFTVENSLAIFDAIADGLQYLHDRDIVHRDLSPNNIILGTAPDAAAATLIDFGISRGQDTAFQTVGTDLAGTPRYLAPEVISGSEPSPASDQYAAAIVLHEMLTGSWPYPESPTAANALHHQLSTTPTPLIETLPDAPAALDHAIQRALLKDPADRFASMDDFRRAVHDRATTEHTAPDPERLGRRPILAIAAIAAVALLIGGITALRTLGGGEGDQASGPATSLVPARTVGAEWAAGDAAGLACNLLDFVDFDDRVLPRNWYLNPIDEAGVDVVDSGGQDNTPALRVGLGERYGLWGEDVAIEPGVTYIFAGTFTTEGSPFVANLTIDWYDANSDALDVDLPAVDLTTVPSGRVSLASTAPADARFAVVQVFKDSSDGSVLVDELVLARADSPCADVL